MLNSAASTVAYRFKRHDSCRRCNGPDSKRGSVRPQSLANLSKATLAGCVPGKQLSCLESTLGSSIDGLARDAKSRSLVMVTEMNGLGIIIPT